MLSELHSDPVILRACLALIDLHWTCESKVRLNSSLPVVCVCLPQESKGYVVRVLEVNQFRELRGPARHECPQSDEYVELKERDSLYEGAFSHLKMPEAQGAYPLVDLSPLKPHRGLTEIAAPSTM